MAYTAVLSVKNTINHFLNSPRISIVSTSRAILEIALAEVASLQQVLKRLDDRSRSSKRLDDLDAQIRDAVRELEDILEIHESDRLESYSDGEYSSRILSVDLEEIRKKIYSVVEEVKKMKEQYDEELEKDGEDDDEDEEDGVSSIDFGVEMVGLSDEYAQIKSELLRRMRPDDFVVFPIFGVAGSGRTLVGKGVFDDLCTEKCDGKPLFDCGAWARVGPNYEFKEIMTHIIAQINHSGLELGDEKSMVEYFHTSLKRRRCMIVLDDVCDPHILQYLIRCFPEYDNGSVLMFTTSINELCQVRSVAFGHKMYTFVARSAWDIIRCATIGLQPCPPDHEKAGMKIAENTRGCCLQIFKAILYLWKAKITIEYWDELAADEKNHIFVVDDEISEICKVKEDMQQLYNSVLDDYQRKFMDDVLIKILPFSHEVEIIKITLFPKRFLPKIKIYSFYGMAGIGKTTLVKKLIEDSSISHDTHSRVWITIGQKYDSKRILVDILAQIYPDIDTRDMIKNEGLVKDLCAGLSLKKFLIVLDDVWDQKPLHYLKKLFPNIKGKVLLTTRLVKVAQFGPSDRVQEVRLLKPEESWSLFCRKVFAGELCPINLEEVGKKICESCEGLPLLILTVADLLSRDDKTPEYWNEVAEKKSSLFLDAQAQISKVLLPSYKSLPQYLKAFFLYMAVFPQSYRISITKFSNLWNAEGFLEQGSFENTQDFIAECLRELFNRSLVMVYHIGSNFRAKTYLLHSVFWHLSTSEASKSIFFHTFDNYIGDQVPGIEIHRRLCVHNNILLSIKDVCDSIASASSAHSLLCNGPPHRYQVPIYFGLRLLRVIDALTIRLYEFPIELVKSIHLRYLALTCSGKIPTSISKLGALQYLILGQYLSIKSSNDSWYLPAEIWDLKELRHLQITGRHLPNPNCGVTLPNLLTLLDVSAQSCTKRVLKRIPNVKKLGIRIELTPGSEANPFHCLNRIWRLRKLESLKCVVVNPELRSTVTPPAPRSMFPSRLKKLSLSGLGYPLKYLSIIGKLQNLSVLKLKSFAFRGPKLETTYHDLTEIKFLSIEDTDLEHFGVIFGTLANLQHLSFKHCYKLKELPDKLPPQVEKLLVVDCNPLVVNWAMKMKELSACKLLQVRSSWDDDFLKQ